MMQKRFEDVDRHYKKNLRIEEDDDKNEEEFSIPLFQVTCSLNAGAGLIVAGLIVAGELDAGELVTTSTRLVHRLCLA